MGELRRGGRRTDYTLEVSGAMRANQPDPWQPALMADEVEPSELAELVSDIQHALWWDNDVQQWVADKEVDFTNLVEFLHARLTELGLAPGEKE